MPTGYTADIKDGISFNDFVMRCARAFGATVDMREEPLDAEIPESFEPHSYHAKTLAKVRAELDDVRGLTNAQADDRAAFLHQREERDRKRRLAEIEDQRAAYEQMLAEVRAWTPPTEEHVALKEFMAQQLEESIKFDCHEDMYREPKAAMTGSEWRAKRIGHLKWEIDYHEKKHAEELERAAGRNAWIKALRDSLQAEA